MPKRILIVDDVESMRMLMRNYLEKDGYEVEEAGDGEEVLCRVEDNPPDLIIMDVLMPKVDGIECCRRIKENTATKDVPVIMVTHKDSDERKQESFAAKCDAYIAKPIQKDELLSSIQLLLRDR